MPDFLLLPNLKTVSVNDHGNFYQVQAIEVSTPSACPTCTHALYGHGSECQKYIDIPIHGKPVIIAINRKRYRCTSCGKTIYAPLPDLHPKRLSTLRLVKYVEEKSLNQTFSSLATEVGIDEKSISNIFDDYICELKKTVKFKTPNVLGIDDVKCSGSFRCILTNVEKLSIFDLLDSCDPSTLDLYFKAMPDKSHINIVVMDPSTLFRKIVKEHLSSSMIVADRFHVTKTANDALEKIRRKIWRTLDKEVKAKLSVDRHKLKNRKKTLSQEDFAKLEIVLKTSDDLRAAYDAKERFCGLYEHETRQKAEAESESWLSQLSPNIQLAFKPCVALLKSWHREIFNHYDYPISNGYTESANRILKDIERAGRGYNFETLRSKFLFNEKSRKSTTQSIRKSINREINLFGLVGSFTELPKSYETVFIEQEIEFGPHMPTLSSLLINGEIR